MKSIVGAALLVVVAACSAASSADGTATRVRGTVERLTDTVLTVRSRDGPSVDVALSPEFTVTGVQSANAADIKTGDYVGVASLPTSAGGDGALEVLIFPAAMKGANEGSFPWDLQPNSTMTNATVSNAVESVDGRTLTLTYPTGSKTVTLAQGIPVVAFADATKADLVAGATVFVPATKDSAGKMSAGFVVVGKNGVVPPM